MHFLVYNWTSLLLFVNFLCMKLKSQSVHRRRNRAISGLHNIKNWWVLAWASKNPTSNHSKHPSNYYKYLSNNIAQCFKPKTRLKQHFQNENLIKNITSTRIYTVVLTCRLQSVIVMDVILKEKVMVFTSSWNNEHGSFYRPC